MGCCASKAPEDGAETTQVQLDFSSHVTSTRPSAQPITLQAPERWPAELPAYLQLGLTLEGIEQQIKLNDEVVPSPLPSGSKIYEHTQWFDCSCVTQRRPCGYADVERIKADCKQRGDGRSVCERLRDEGSPHVGRANVFVSWWLGAALQDLASALRRYLEQHGLDARTTFFWICSYSFRQTGLLPDPTPLPDRMAGVIGAVGRVAILMDPWDAPAPLKRAW